MLLRRPSGPLHREVAPLSNVVVGAARMNPIGSNLTKQQHSNFEYAKWHDIFTPEECADEWMQNKPILSDFVMNGFIMPGRHHVPDGHSPIG